MGMRRGCLLRSVGVSCSLSVGSVMRGVIQPENRDGGTKNRQKIFRERVQKSRKPLVVKEL